MTVLIALLGLTGLFLLPPKQVAKEAEALYHQREKIVAANEGPYQEMIKRLICAGIDSAKVLDYFQGENVRKYVYQSFRDFYLNRGCHLAWHSVYKPLPVADSLLVVLQKAPSEGLWYNYHLRELEEARQRILHQSDELNRPDSVQLSQVVHLDFLFTASYLTYSSHLLSGKIDPDEFDVTWVAHPRKRNLAPLLEKAILYNQISASLDKIRPHYRQYNALKRALVHYTSIAETGGWPTLPIETLRKGDTSATVPLLHKRLMLTGDLAQASSGVNEEVFGDLLEEAVKRYQRRNGLKIDGIAGGITLAMMNKPVEERIDQIRINLERLRWLPDTLGSRYVLVNIPEYRLRVMEEGEVAMDMRVVVGKEYHSTPVFLDTIQYLEFSPTWTVPLSIARNEILPVIRKNPGYLNQKNFLLYDSWHASATPLDPYQINWWAVEPDNFTYRLVQQPGPNNPLGQVKFMFPNKFSIYLHDTPADWLFDRKKRAQSHGCVRVEKPVALAEYLLQNKPGWDRESIMQYMNQPSPKSVSLPKPVPVQFVYRTVFVEEDGTVNFRRDIYSHDELQVSAIQ